MQLPEGLNIASGILDKFLLDVRTIQFTMNSLLAVVFLLEVHPDDEMLNHTKEQGDILITNVIPNAVALGKLINDKFINELNDEDKILFLQSSEILTSIITNSDTNTVSSHSTSNKVH